MMTKFKTRKRNLTLGKILTYSFGVITTFGILKRSADLGLMEVTHVLKLWFCDFAKCFTSWTSATQCLKRINKCIRCPAIEVSKIFLTQHPLNQRDYDNFILHGILTVEMLVDLKELVETLLSIFFSFPFLIPSVLLLCFPFGFLFVYIF